jgi:ribonuclease R
MEERVLSLLRQKKGGLSFHQLAAALRLRGRALTRLRQSLKNLQSRGIVHKKKENYLVSGEKAAVRGEFLSSSRGFGFVRPADGGGEDIFIPARLALGALAGDVVEVAVKEHGRKGKPAGQVVRIMKKARETVLGVYTERYGQPYYTPFDAASAAEIPLSAKGSYNPEPGMIIEVDRKGLTVRAVLGFPDELGVDTQVVIKRFGLATQFSPEAAEEAGRISSRIAVRDREGRKDYRSWRTITIDGESAQDFDDAVSIKKLPSGHCLLGVHIADVSHYVGPGSALDRDASSRATSVYFPDLTLPMLPEALSNDICSLRPRKTRLTMTVLLEIDEKGRVVKEEFHPSVIKTVERMTYTSVFSIFQDEKKERSQYASLVPDILLMRDLASRLRARREEQGSLNFDLSEPELVYREGRIQRVEAFEANEAHHLIEEFMVAANEAVARYLSRQGKDSIFRIHPAPSRTDLEELKSQLEHFGILLPKPENLSSRDLQAVLRGVEGKPEEKFVQIRVLRALRLAAYSPENTGHYGLAKKDYAHFTSPIRRYPDLIVHRALKAALRGEKLKIPAPAILARHCSEQERKADEAERELVEWRIYRFLKGRLGDEFDGIIVDISRSGVIVELEDYFVDGLIPYADLDGDYYRQRSERVLVGRRSGRKFSLGDRIKVILAAVDPVGRRMSLVLSREGAGEHR